MSLKGYLFGVKQSVRRTPTKLLHELRANQLLSADQLGTLNWNRRIALLGAAFKTPFYRKRFAAIGLQMGDVKSEKDWARIPVLTRKDIQENMEDLVQDGLDRKRLTISSTGGSTGEPLRLYRPRGIPLDVFATRMLGWWNVDMWDNSCYIFRHGYNGWRKVVNDLMWWPTKRVFLNAGNMDDEKCEAFYQRLCAIKPKLLVGYVGAVSHFAEYMVRNGLNFPFEMKAAWTTSAPLPEPLRMTLQSTFGCPVYSQYGCCECGHLAAECSCQKGMHIHWDWRHIDIVDDSGKGLPVGQSGNVLITDLYAMEVPLIRYALGDRGRLLAEKCGCGINLPLMAPVSGRVSEAFPMPDGSRLSGDYLTTIFDRFPDAVRGFRVHQRADYSVCVEYVPRVAGVAERAINDARKNLLNITRGQVPIEFNVVASIPHDRGKTRYVTTDVREAKP